MTYKWGVFRADLDPVVGSEQRGKRRVLVISDETFNGLMPVVTVLPLTSRKPGRTIYPNEALAKAGSGGLETDSIVLAHQIRAIAKQRLQLRLGSFDDSALRGAINASLRVHLNL